jgi:hypothetical protein
MKLEPVSSKAAFKSASGRSVVSKAVGSSASPSLSEELILSPRAVKVKRAAVPDTPPVASDRAKEKATRQSQAAAGAAVKEKQEKYNQQINQDGNNRNGVKITTDEELAAPSGGRKVRELTASSSAVTWKDEVPGGDHRLTTLPGSGTDNEDHQHDGIFRRLSRTETATAATTASRRSSNISSRSSNISSRSSNSNSSSKKPPPGKKLVTKASDGSISSKPKQKEQGQGGGKHHMGEQEQLARRVQSSAMEEPSPPLVQQSTLYYIILYDTSSTCTCCTTCYCYSIHCDAIFFLLLVLTIFLHHVADATSPIIHLYIVCWYQTGMCVETNGCGGVMADHGPHTHLARAGGVWQRAPEEYLSGLRPSRPSPARLL